MQKIVVSGDWHTGLAKKWCRPAEVRQASQNMANMLEKMKEENNLKMFIFNGDLAHLGSTTHPRKDFSMPLAKHQLRPLGEILGRSGTRTVVLPGNWDPQLQTDDDLARQLLSDESGKIRMELPGMHFQENGLFVTHGHTLSVSMKMFLKRMFRLNIQKDLHQAGEAIRQTLSPNGAFLQSVEEDDHQFHTIADMIAFAKESTLRCLGPSRKLVDDWHEDAINDVFAGALAAGLAQITPEEALPEIKTAVLNHTHTYHVWTRQELQKLLSLAKPDGIPRYIANAGTAGLHCRWHGTALVTEPNKAPTEVITWQPHIRDRVSTKIELHEIGRHMF